MAAGTLYTPTFVEEVFARLGWAWEPREVTLGKRPVMEIAGIDQRLIGRRSTRRQRIADVTEGQRNLNDGRFELGDVGAAPSSLGLCGNVAQIQAPAVLIDKQREAPDRQEEIVDIARQLNPADMAGSIRPTTSVLLTVTESSRP